MTPIEIIRRCAKQLNDYLASLPVETEQSCAGEIEMELAVITSSRTGLNECSPVGGFRRGWRDAIQWISLGTDKPNHGLRDYEKAPDGVEDEPSRHPLPERAEGEKAGEPSEWAKNAADELWNKLSPYLHLEISGADDKLIISALDAARKTGRLDEYATVASIIFDDRNHVQWEPTKNPNEAVRDAMRHLADRLRIERDKIIGGGAEAMHDRSPLGASGPNTPNKDRMASAPSPEADRGREIAEKALCELRNAAGGLLTAIRKHQAGRSIRIPEFESAGARFEAEWSRHEDGHHSVTCKNLARQFYFAAVFGSVGVSR